MVSNFKNEDVLFIILFIILCLIQNYILLIPHSYKIINSISELSKLQIKKKLLNSVVLFFSICIEMDGIRKAILKRDNYKCQDCNISNKKLTIHHIKESHKHPELKFKRYNLITLCQRCHSLKHNNKVKWLVVTNYHHIYNIYFSCI